MQTFVRQMDRLESSLNFVGYNKLCTQWMLDWGIASTEYECYRLIDQWLYDEIVERHDVAEPEQSVLPHVGDTADPLQRQRARPAGFQHYQGQQPGDCLRAACRILCPIGSRS